MQEKYLSKDQMQAILDTRPKGVSMDDALNMYVKNGWTIQGVNEQPTVVQQAKDVATGFVKGAGRTALGTATGLQDIGQGILGGVEALATGKSLSETKAMQPGVGIDLLKTETPEGQALADSLAAKNRGEELGGYAETGAELLLGGGAGLVKDATVFGGKLLAKGISPVTSLVKKGGEVLYKSAFTPSVREAENILAYEASQPATFSRLYGAGAIKGNSAFKPITVGETALRSGVAGTEKQVGVQAKRVADTLYKKEIAPAVDSIDGVITKDELFAPIKERIAGITDPSKRKAYEDAFEALAEDYKDVIQYTFKEAQKLKSEIAEFTPAKVFRGQDVANEFRMLKADMADAIRQKTYDALKDVNIKQKYIDYGNLQELQKVGVKAISEGGLKGGFGGFWSTVYDKAMTPVKTVGGKVIYHIGDKLQVTAPKGFEGKSFAEYLKAVGFLVPQVAEEVVNTP
jgi:hypothetical protein